jgi:hypothetical protein
MELHVDYNEHLMITRGEDEVGRARSLLVLACEREKERSELLISIFLLSFALSLNKEIWKLKGVGEKKGGGVGEKRKGVEEF